jgi:low affinity Fe/Cu permease
VVNTATTIVTFLMVFVLQNSQNRDSKAIQTKLDELILTSKAQNKFIGVENLDENELRALSKSLHKQAERIEAKVDRKRTKKKPVAQTAKSASLREEAASLQNSSRTARNTVVPSTGKSKS